MSNIRNIFAAAEPLGNQPAVQRFVREASDAKADAVFLLGGLKQKSDSPKTIGEILKTLSHARLPSFYIPGPDDSPVSEYLREAANFEVVFPHLHGAHGTFAFAPGYVLVGGLGGTIEDDPHSVREEISRLSYPAWEVEYRLKFLRELKDYQKVFLFTTPPAHKGRSETGSTSVAEIIKTHNPRLALVAGEDQKHEMLGTSLVVFLGSLSKGQFSVIDFRKSEVEHRHLAESVDTAA
jgi:Icc-related predicted phosphoesterase